MLHSPGKKYKPLKRIQIPDRTWPDRSITTPPIWCSVDLRDGNQALIEPMNLEQKLEMFRLLVDIGFREIEVGFPSAAEIEFAFVRYLIEHDLIPDGVAIQVLTQAREHLIRRTFEAIDGAKLAIVHLYNSTSTLQRKVVFRADKPEITRIAVEGTQLVRELAEKTRGTKIQFEYSPESFTGTEIEYAVEICSAVVDEWKPTPEKKMILNLPSTVELAPPNVYADQIEWFCRHVNRRDSVIVSLHTHNDRGCAVAATELGLMAGAERVEGTLFGNGERTGNVDIVTLALNMFTEGVHPGLDFSNINKIIAVSDLCTNIPVHIRWPYAGELVFTAFSGSHQDAINKGMLHTAKSGSELWEVPYLPIDPRDIGRSYEGVVRINSQSGKGGVAYLMRKEHGFHLPKEMHPEFAKVIQALSEASGKEILPDEIWEAFTHEYISATTPVELLDFRSDDSISSHRVRCRFSLNVQGRPVEITGEGNGPIDALKMALTNDVGLRFDVHDYSQHALGEGASAEAVSYVGITLDPGKTFYGVGLDSNITLSGLKALMSSINRALRRDVSSIIRQDRFGLTLRG